MKKLFIYLSNKLIDKRTRYLAAKTDDLSYVIWEYAMNSYKKCCWKLNNNPELDPLEVALMNLTDY